MHKCSPPKDVHPPRPIFSDSQRSRGYDDDYRPGCRCFAAIAALALAAAALGLLLSTAEAQESETLLSNTGQDL